MDSKKNYQTTKFTNNQLPTLGLNNYKDVDLQNDRKNPFSVQKQTEQLLVVRERQREFKGFNKLEQEGLHVHEKEK